ncbi:hypothetical protein Tco_0110954 [Tanacetum coccineum]
MERGDSFRQTGEAEPSLLDLSRYLLKLEQSLTNLKLRINEAAVLSTFLGFQYEKVSLPDVRSKIGEPDIDTLTREHYLALTRGNQASGVNDDAHEHVERVLDIISLLNMLGVTHDTVMLRVFPITLTRVVKRWFDMIPSRKINTWDMLKKAFI